jgi:hypothetical protein
MQAAPSTSSPSPPSACLAVAVAATDQLVVPHKRHIRATSSGRRFLLLSQAAPLAAPDRRDDITTVFKQVMSMANLMLDLPRLTEHGCCETVAFALQEYGHSRYANSALLACVRRGDLSALALVPREDAIAALRCWARWTVWPQVHLALRLLKPD